MVMSSPHYRLDLVTTLCRLQLTRLAMAVSFRSGDLGFVTIMLTIFDFGVYHSAFVYN